MTIRFESIPSHLQSKIICGMSFKDYAAFRESSRFTFNLKPKISFPLPLNVDDLLFREDGTLTYRYRQNILLNEHLEKNPVRMIIPELRCNIDHFTHEHCNQLISIFKSTKSVVNSLWISIIADDCDKEILDNFLQIAEVKSLYGYSNLDECSCFKLPGFRKLETIRISGIAENDEFLALEASTIIMTSYSITVDGVKEFFNQFIKGDRKIEYFWLEASMDNDNKTAILELPSYSLEEISQDDLKSRFPFAVRHGPIDYAFLIRNVKQKKILVYGAEWTVMGAEIDSEDKSVSALSY